MARRYGETGLGLATSEQTVESAGDEIGSQRKKGAGVDTLDPDLVDDLLDITVADGPRAFRDLIRAFLISTERYIAIIRRDIAAGDAGGLTRSAHTLKGSSGCYGARRLSALARQLETIGRRGSTDDAAAVLAQLEAEFERVKCAFAALQGEQGGEA